MEAGGSESIVRSEVVRELGAAVRSIDGGGGRTRAGGCQYREWTMSACGRRMEIMSSVLKAAYDVLDGTRRTTGVLSAWQILSLRVFCSIRNPLSVREDQVAIVCGVSMMAISPRMSPIRTKVRGW